MTITQTPLERAAISWADSAALLAAELARIAQPAAIPMRRTHRRKTPAYLRVVPIAVGAASAGWAAAREVLRHHAAAAAWAAVTTAAAVTVAVPAIAGLTVRTPYDYDPVHHHVVAARPDHATRLVPVIPVVPAAHKPRVNGTFSPPPRATSQVSATPGATPSPATSPAPSPSVSASVSTPGQQTCVTVLVQLCLPVP